MSIATAITNLQGRVESAYDKIEERGGTLPQVLNTANLPDAIDSIPSGGSTPKWGFTSLEEVCYTDADGDFRPFNGVSSTTLNFTGVKSMNKGNLTKAFAGNTTVLTASFPDLSSIGSNALREAFANSKIRSVSFPALSVGDAGTYTLSSAFYGCFDLSSVSFPKLTSLSTGGFKDAFYGCSSLVSVSFPKLSSVATSAFTGAFYNCTGLTSVSFPALSSVNNSGSVFDEAFSGCSSLVSVSFPELTYGCSFNKAFSGCSSLVSVSFPKLSSINGGSNQTIADFTSAFYNCSNLTAVSFPALVQIGTNGNYAFTNAFTRTQVGSLTFPELTAIVANTGSASSGCFYTDAVSAYYFPKLKVLKKTAAATSNNNAQYIFKSTCKEIHFAAENQAVIEASQYYSNRWGAGTECQVFFDL